MANLFCHACNAPHKAYEQECSFCKTTLTNDIVAIDDDEFNQERYNYHRNKCLEEINKKNEIVSNTETFIGGIFILWMALSSVVGTGTILSWLF